jgi:hypothetical protein
MRLYAGRRMPIPMLVSGDEAQTARPTDFEWGWLNDLLHTQLGTSTEYHFVYLLDRGYARLTSPEIPGGKKAHSPAARSRNRSPVNQAVLWKPRIPRISRRLRLDASPPTGYSQSI